MSQIGEIAYYYIEEIENEMNRLRDNSKGSTDLVKCVGEFLELHYLLGWTLQFPLKMEKGFFEQKKTHKGDFGKNQNQKQIDQNLILIRRKHCKNCGFSRKSKKDCGLEYCKYCGLYVENYVFKDYPGKMLRSERLNSRLWDIIKKLRERVLNITVMMEQKVRNIGNPQDLWNVVGYYDFMILNAMESISESYNMI